LADPRSIYDSIAGIYAPVAAVVFVLVLTLTVVALVRGTRRARRTDRPAGDRAEDTRIEGPYVVLLIVVAAALIVISFHHEDRLQAATHRPAPIHVDVLAAKWRWGFSYRGAGVLTEGRLVVPAGTPIAFTARSEDVLHAFWVPGRRFQRQVFPDRVTAWTLQFPPGVHDGVCAWFCGLRHDHMDFTVEAVSPAAFRRWLDARRGSAP
jgi:heme/copper-type cytochrome/quinol oxidase subunit 2